MDKLLFYVRKTDQLLDTYSEELDMVCTDAKIREFQSTVKDYLSSVSTEDEDEDDADSDSSEDDDSDKLSLSDEIKRLGAL